jgi:hypothetical protein
LKLLMQELGALYAHHALGAAAPLPATAQLRDHLQRLARLRAHPEFEARQRWWRAKLIDPPPPLPFAPDGPAPDSTSRPGRRLRLPVTMRARSSLEELSRRHSTTMFSTALAVTLAYLHRLFERADILIGIGGSGRSPEEAGLVAQAAQLLPVRSRLAPGAKFEEFLRAVATEVTTLAAGHTEIELAPLLAPVLSSRGRRHGPLNVTFNLDRIDPTPPSAGLAARLLEGPVLGAKFDLCINLTVGKDDWQIDFDFDADAFSASGIRRLAERWMAWVEGLVGQASIAIADYAGFDAAALRADEVATSAALARAPECEIEQALLAHWRDELCLEVTGVHDDFVNAGGQSLAAARLAAWIQESWQVSIGLQRILAGPTIAELAQMLEQARSAGPQQQIQPRRRRGAPPPASGAAQRQAGS